MYLDDLLEGVLNVIGALLVLALFIFAIAAFVDLMQSQVEPYQHPCASEDEVIVADGSCVHVDELLR